MKSCADQAETINNKYSSPDVLEKREIPKPVPKDNEVQKAIHYLEEGHAIGKIVITM
jgi:hypothetical protein